MRLRPFLLLIICAMVPCPASASHPGNAPILRVETGRHTAPIIRVATDAEGRWLVTASVDKSLRVWELPSGLLSRTILPPVGEENEGKLYSVALSPDGGTIACGGWTQLGSDSGHTIYLFDRGSGRMTGRIQGVSQEIMHLAFSPDGRYLAASLGGTSGVRLYRTADWSPAGEDRKYGGGSNSAHFSRDGGLVTACEDGYLRLYEVSHGTLRPVAKEKAPGGRRPYAARFSPDGRKIAVGYSDSARVSVLSGRDLSLLFSPDTSGVQNGNLINVTWSADGRYLFAAGSFPRQFDGGWKRPIRRWHAEGRGGYSDIPAAENTVMDLAPLPDGSIAFGAGDPAIGLIDQGGKRSLFVPPAIADYRSNGNALSVSGDGSGLSFSSHPGGAYPASFDLTTRSFTGGSTSALKPPITYAYGLAIGGWKNTAGPTLNGARLQLQHYEVSRALAIAPDGSSFVLGTEWYLRRFDRQGREMWKVTAPGSAWAVNVAGNGRVALAAFGDGTIRWYRMSDGRELLAFFHDADRKRWVLWTPSGYFDASPEGEELIGWQVNKGRDEAADFFPASKFRAAYYRPDVIATVLEALDDGEALHMADAARGRRPTAATVPSHRVPPVVTIISPADRSSHSSGTVTVRYALRSPEDAPATAIRVLVDGRGVSRERGVKLVAKDGEQSVVVSVPERDCELSVIAENRHAASEPATVRLTWGGKERQEGFLVQPKLYLLAVGVSAYRAKDLTLRYAAKDAQDLAASFMHQKGLLYRDVQTKVLTDEHASKDDVMDGLDWLQQEVTAKDVGVIFLAGHGVNDSSGSYYYLPQNADTEKLRRTGVPFSDIKSVVASLAGKAVLFVDTCHAGNVMGTRRGAVDIKAVVNELASAENGAVVFASSTGRQYSLEDERWGNGAFTKALVEGLDGKADLLGKGKITVNMLEAWLAERVKELTGGKQTPTTSKPQTIQDFPIAVKR